MFFESCKSILYSDTLVPDIFITEYMPLLSSDSVKVYLYSLFLSKHNKKASTEEFAKSMGLEVSTVKECLAQLESMGVLTWKEDGLVLHDLKEKRSTNVPLKNHLDTGGSCIQLRKKQKTQ